MLEQATQLKKQLGWPVQQGVSVSSATSLSGSGLPFLASQSDMAYPPSDRLNVSMERLGPQEEFKLSGAPTQEEPSPATTPGHLDVYVIDEFKAKTINLTRGDNTPDVSHGELVARVIERGLKVPVNRVELVEEKQLGLGNAFVDPVVKTLDRIFDLEAARQGVAREQVDLSHVRVNMSFAFDYLVPEQQRVLQPIISEFVAHGGRIYVSAGNESRNALMDVPGVIGVDGSDDVLGAEGAIGGASTRYRNGEVSRIAPGTIVPQVLADGGVDINGDAVSDFTASELAPIPEAPLAGLRLSDNNTLDAGTLDEWMNRDWAARNTFPDSGLEPNDPSFPARNEALKEEVRQFVAGKVVTLADAQRYLDPAGNGIGDVLREQLPVDLDPATTYLGVEDLIQFRSSFGGPSLVFYRVDAGQLARIDQRGAAAPIEGLAKPPLRGSLRLRR